MKCISQVGEKCANKLKQAEGSRELWHIRNATHSHVHTCLSHAYQSLWIYTHQHTMVYLEFLNPIPRVNFHVLG
jgi:hypothetical protein